MSRTASLKTYSSKQLHTPLHGKASYCLVRFEGERYHVAAQYERALCGLDVTSGTRCEIPTDFGKDVDDCDACVAAWERIDKAQHA